MVMFAALLCFEYFIECSRFHHICPFKEQVPWPYACLSCYVVLYDIVHNMAWTATAMTILGWNKLSDSV